MTLTRNAVLLPVVALLALSLGPVATSIPAEAVALPGSVPPVAALGTVTGAADPSQVLDLSVALRLADQSGLDRLVHDQYTPGSPDFHRFLDPVTFGRRFGASDSSVSAVSAALAGMGFTVKPVAPNHLTVDFSGTVGMAESAFGVDMLSFRFADGRTFVANTDQVRLPRALAANVTQLVGLSTAPIRRGQLTTGDRLPVTAAPSRSLPNAANAAPAAPCGQSQSGGYTTTEFTPAYDFTGLYGAGISGQGMNLGIVEFDDYTTQWVQNWETCMGISPDPVVRRPVLGGSGGRPLGGEVEALLDVEVALEMLPNVNHIYMYVAPNTDTAELDLYNQYVNDNNAPVLSSSWGSCEALAGQGFPEAVYPVYEEAAAQGQDILEAAGDSGSIDCRGSTTVASNLVNVEFEAALPFATGVGGTNLTYPAVYPAGATHQETTWNGGGQGSLDGGAGGGGISDFWPMPNWQSTGKGVQALSNGAQCNAPSGQVCRTVPDVSANADFGSRNPANYPAQEEPGSPGYSVYCPLADTNCLSPTSVPSAPTTTPGDYLMVGGTSAATPLTASMFLLSDQLAKSKGLLPLGFLNPAIYRVASGASYSKDFFDITYDSNDMHNSGAKTNGKYPAGTGYDLASGWGSYDATNLANDLVAEAAQITAAPSGVSLYGYIGGPSTSRSVVLTGGFLARTATVTSDSTWLSAPGSHNAPGSLSVTANPAGLAAGTYTGHLTVSAPSAGSDTITVTYSVGPRAAISVSPATLAFSEDTLPQASSTPGGTPTRPAVACGVVWDDEGTDPTATNSSDSSLARTLQTLAITNSGPAGSTLHWAGYPATGGLGGWLGLDANQPDSGNGTAVPNEGSLAAGSTSNVALASFGGIAALGKPLSPGSWPGSFIISDLADPSVKVTVPAILTLGDGTGTPAIAPDSLSVTTDLAPEATGTATVKLTDAAQKCGYNYSAATDVPWASLADPGYSGNVAGGSGQNASVAIALSAKGLSPGTYLGHLTVSSLTALGAPLNVLLRLVVAAPGASPGLPTPPVTGTSGGTLPNTSGPPPPPWGLGLGLCLPLLLAGAALRRRGNAG
ncbi:MAG: S53 family peptidase [Candidatus Dormibacteria bacterium]